MICWHVEKGRVCIYSQIKSCSVSEMAAMIERESGRSAFSYLLGFWLLHGGR
jgi:TnpA family transposase